MPKGERTPPHAVASGCRVPVVASGAIRSRRSGLTYTGMGPATMMDMKLNAERIRTLREQRAWSQEHLATVAGLSTRTLQRIEAGAAASQETCMALAAALDVPVRLITGTPQPTDISTGPSLPRPVSPASSWIMPAVLLVCLVVWFGYSIGKDMAERDNRATAGCDRDSAACESSRPDAGAR